MFYIVNPKTKRRESSRMSDKINNDALASFKPYTKNEKKQPIKEVSLENNGAQQKTNQINSLGDGAKNDVYGRAQVQASRTSQTAFSGDVPKDVEFFKNNPELVEFHDDIFNARIEKGMPYNEALDTAFQCSETFRV